MAPKNPERPLSPHKAEGAMSMHHSEWPRRQYRGREKGGRARRGLGTARAGRGRTHRSHIPTALLTVPAPNAAGPTTRLSPPMRLEFALSTHHPNSPKHGRPAQMAPMEGPVGSSAAPERATGMARNRRRAAQPTTGSAAPARTTLPTACHRTPQDFASRALQHGHFEQLGMYSAK